MWWALFNTTVKLEIPPKKEGIFEKSSNLSRILFHVAVAGSEGTDKMDIKGMPTIYLTVPYQHLPGGTWEITNN
jgi:hypothetical protein